MVADLRALERLPRQVSLAELRDNPALRKVKFLKNVRLIISPVTRGGVSGDSAHGRNRGLAGPAASLIGRRAG